MGLGIILLFWIICISVHVVNVSGCQLQGVNPILVRVVVNILDVDEGIIYNNQIIDIAGLTSVVQNPGLNSGPYIRGYISGTTFYLETTDNFKQYERHETESSIVLNAQFRCSDGTSTTQVFQINITDTNNNSPEFLPSSEYNIAVATPLLPGHQITGCQHNIVVKDIDLTTSRIDFALTGPGSDLFEIEYDEESSTTAKEFIAVLRTSTFIRSLPEPLELTVSATDVDATGDPPRTSTATVRITADSDAVLPEEPIFSQPLYTATYTEDNTIILDDTISLQQGYHEDVLFSLNEEFSSYFAIIRNGNDISLSVTAPLTTDILTRQQLYLILRADREFTSGATATIVVQLPEEIGLQFERASYEGVIEDNTLILSNLVLTQGYEDAEVTVAISNDYFSATIQGNSITLSLQPLTHEIIQENTFLNLEVTARTERSSATTVVILEIVKDDTVTPVFQNPIYIGSYDAEIGLTLGAIELMQGFDDTVEISLDGEHSGYFQLLRNGPTSTLTVESLPLEELGEQTIIILTIHASKARTVGATASIYISLPEEIRLAFQHASYEGSIIDNTLQVPNLVLTQGYENQVVTVSVSNEFFTAYIQGNVITLSMAQLSEAVIQENSFLNLEVTAVTPRSSASAIVTLEIIKDDTITPLFENALYSGTYTVEDGLTLGQIIIVQGYDETVDVTLQGEYSNLFQLVRNGASSTLTGSVPAALFSQRNIALTVTATRPRTVGSTAVINIALPTDRVLEFGATTYRGTYQNNILTLGAITLTSGYDDTIVFQLSDYNQYFEVTNVVNQVSIQQLQPLPDSIILENNFLALILTASGLNALSASTSVLIEIIKEDLSTPVFSKNIYSAAYADGDVVIQDINLIQGFDSTVSFRLDGDYSEYFSLNQAGNAVTLSLSSAIPEEVIFNHKTLVFSILAEKPLTVGANAVILVTFPSELTDSAVMRFSQNTYIGSLEDGNLNVESIVLSTGYAQGTQFFLTGDYSSHFALSTTNEIISITTLNTLPQEVIEENAFIVLEVEARRDRAVSVYSSVIIELIQDEKIVEIPVFNAAYYRGSYDLEEGLQFAEQVYLVQGYDDTISFELQGEHSEYFSVSDNNNVVTLSANALPENVWESNDQLIFSIIANKPDSQNARAAIIIHMPKDITETTILGFERTNYVGSLASENVTLDAITLTEGYSEDVSFTLHGELQNYFSLIREGATVRLQLPTAIPEESLPSNGIIVLETQASKTNSRPAVTTVILEVVREITPDINNLVFERTYYVGTYTTTDSLTFDNTISLAEGYDDSVRFSLDGDDSSYFSIIQTANIATLVVIAPIPPAVIAQNNQLIFAVNAQSSSGATARATIVIALPDEISDTVILGFERSNYIGSIENEVINLDSITLTEGYTSDVIFTLHGDLQNYFNLTRNEATVTLLMPNAIPENSIPTNGLIILEVQAFTTNNSLSAVTTVVLEVIRDTTPDIENVMFAQTYYLGTYTTTEGLTFENTISLVQGYDESVQFTLDGDDSIYFAIIQTGNSASLTMLTAIPPAVIINNNQLVFVVNAQSSADVNAGATIVISLSTDITDSFILGFERNNYQGSINNELITLDPITLSEGYTADIIFTLYGELQNYFTLSQDGATINLLLSNAIPEETVPSNGIIVLEIQASTSTDALPAITTVILEVIRDTTPEVDYLEFSQTFYVGIYNTEDGLSLERTISLVQGYDDNVQFTLEGDDATYFGISQSGNSLSLTLSSSVPPSVIANNNQLIFEIIAQSTGGATARATIIITLPNEVSDSVILGFERTYYLGSISDGVVSLDPITLSEGYSDTIEFTLHGYLQNYFILSRNGPIVSLQLSNAIPEDSIPENGIIILEVQASTTTNALPAVTTIILEVIRDTTPEVEELVFSQTFYVGTYTIADGLSLENTISLIEGYNDNVQFTLEGDDANYFGISQSGNSLSLTLSTTIPPTVIVSNNHLIFAINAQSIGGATAQATVVIALPNEISDNGFLGFENSNYLGSINNEGVSLDPITLSEGYTDAVVFTLHGDLQNYFNLARNGATVTVQLLNTIPEDSIPTSGIIILEVQAATTTNALPAVTIVVLEVVRDTTPEVELLVFSQTFYIGTYTTTDGLSLESTISLAEGYDDNVQFTLEGDHATYFGISQSGNTLLLILSTSIPPAVIANNNQLVFAINAQSTGGASAKATIVITLLNEISDDVVLGFQRTYYLGSINNEVITLDPITLSEGYTDAVVFTLYGDLESYFTLARNGATVTLQLSNTIPEDSISVNGIVILEVQASTTTDTLPAVATIILEVIRDTTPEEDLLFSQFFYVGTYTATDGLSLENTISLLEGYNENVQFTLEGDDSAYFEISQSGNSLSLTQSASIPPAVVANNNQLIFEIIAKSTGGASARATIVINLPNVIFDSVILGFERTNYLGSLSSGVVSLDPITLSEGYSNTVVFTLHGDLQSYFTLSLNGPVVTLQLSNAIPEDAIPANGIIVLEVQASTNTDALPAVTTIILEVIRETTDLVFSQTFYVGTYTTADGLSLESTISLLEGYDDNVQFSLDGDDATYFEISQSGNSLMLTLSTTIPPAVIANNNHLIFAVNAQSIGGATARATVFIALPNEIADNVILGFERTNYLGSINNESLTLDPITLSEGYTDAVVFTLHGDLQSYFTLARNGATVTLQLSNTIPEDLMPTNGIVILEIQASTTTDALPAIATIILDVINDTTNEFEDLLFSQTFYVGTYTTTDGLSHEDTISLLKGYNENVQFTLEGDDSAYFGISQSGNSLSLTLSTSIPPAVVANNNQLIFEIIAQSTGGATARATIVITLPNEISDSVILGFERTNYLGSIYNESLTLDPITLSEGYTDSVVFTLRGELQSYFVLERNGATVTLQLSNTIPEDSIPTNGIIILEVQASTITDALPAIATIILEVIRDTTPEVEDLLFSQTFYVGTYTTTDGVSHEDTISLLKGYNENVQFTLEGDDSAYFGISQSDNSLSLTLSTSIPPAVVANNNQLIFEIIAQSTGGATARATIVITLPNEISDSVILGFERTNYLGSIYNESLTLDPITLSEGYTDSVVFTLRGDLQSYFFLARNGATVTLQLSNTIPEDSIPTNGIVILEVQASTITDALPAIATIILEVIRDTTPEVEDLLFTQTFYVGTYTTTDGLSHEDTISLLKGYNENVQFTLEGDDSAYFGISQSGNSLSLTLSTSIPPAVVANNNQLIFEIIAQSTGGATARATIVITLPNEISDSVILGFERTNYLGSIYNKSLTLDPITLSEGYTDSVVFTLRGELQSYFVLERNGATVTLQLSNTIPEDSIPTNGIVILEVQASTITDALPAIATIILEVIRDTTPEVEDLLFSQTFYVGTYTTTDGVSHEDTISLLKGYNENVQFTLEGDDSAYFGISQSGNSLSLTLSTSIPPAVVANNNQLIFEIIAQSTGGATARATIVITLPNEISDSVILGFERTNYLGSIYNESLTLDPITLSEGYTDSVVFTLRGDLQSYFFLARNGATVTLQLSNTIPEDSIPTNGIVILEVQASTITDALPAIATIILEVIRDTTPEVEDLLFTQTFYVGTYTTTDGLSHEDTISLLKGYNENVQFTLEGDDSAYFGISQSGNSLSLTLSTSIPPAVVANNNQLIFEIIAQSTGGATARATIVINLPNEISDSVVLGFERTNYLGSISNGVVSLDPITLSEGYSDTVVFTLHGVLQSYFTILRNGPIVFLQLSNAIPEDSISANGIIILEIQASTTTDALPAVTTIILEVMRETTPEVEDLVFSQTFYVGTYTIAGGLSLESTISLSEGYDDNVQFTLDGDDATYFGIAQSGNSLSLTLSTVIPPAVIANNNQLIFIITALSPKGANTQATVIIRLHNEINENVILGFERTSYLGSVSNGAVAMEPITLTEGYIDSVTFSLFGELQSYFELSRNGATVTVQLQNTIPEELVPTNGIIILGVQASMADSLPAVATIVLEVERLDGGPTVTFSKVLYEGLLQASTVEHEAISVTGYDETTTVEIRGVYSELFTASLIEGVVTVQGTGSITVPADVTHVAVEIHVRDAAAVLLLQVEHTDTPNPQPTVTFSSSNYEIRAEVLQTGVIGRISATADNGESLVYSVVVVDAHLAARLSVSSDGELVLSSPANSGEYTFQVVATTLITQASGTATVQLTVEETSIIMPPLIVLYRDEEEAHDNLVVFNSSEYSDCTYTLTNRFPANQDWLYVNETGLHAKIIDREDPSIAFMALSQVHVEIEVHCNSLIRNKRSLRETRLDWLGPYDYGTSNWILGESIEHNPARSVVNLIVNDINDNAPIFLGKENEPIAVGYPVPELENIVLPRALAELQATDADVGENAALVYWSAEPVLAVSPTTGSVHVRDDATLEEDMTLVVHATDRNGEGLSASINLVVKLLDESNIAIVTIRDAFLEDEPSIIANLSTSVGYEVKVLRAVVISDETENIEENIDTRNKRQTRGSGASLELYVYGLVQREPVAVEILTEDLNTNPIGAIDIVRTLRDHLETRRIPGRDLGLLVATIVLSILLFILIIAILVWFFLKWRKERNYDEFSDENSLESRNESIGQLAKVDTRPKPRIDIDELKRSERRLQEMIDAPYNEVVTPATSTKAPVESTIDISQPDPNILAPIVIKDKLKDAEEDPSDIDEFGEVRPPRRKSVVTFNENVERIIHVDDGVEGSSTSSDIEVFRF